MSDTPPEGQGEHRKRRRRRRSRRDRRPPSLLPSLLRFGGRVIAFLLVLAMLGTGFAVALVYISLPDAQEEVAIPGLSAPVAISLDADGIPRISAANETDAAAALGWLHARDRMFQMEMMRRGAEGRLAEILGENALRLDRFSRTLGLARRAREDLDAAAPETRALLDAYARGVNTWINTRGRLAAPEFLALGEPELWQPEHSLLWGKVMGLWLSGSWRRDVERARLARSVPPERLPLLWPDDESRGRLDLAALPAAETLAALLDRLPVFGEDAPLPSSASNAWAVGSARSASGAPLLASDPHLGFQAPVIWYLARIELPDGRFRAGATAPGVPGVVIGRNERLAWGFTTTHSDTQDVFIERVVDRMSYATPEGPRPFVVRDEVITIRGRSDPERMRVRETRNGPVVSDLDPEQRLVTETVLAVAMANLAPRDTSADALMALNRATTQEQARAAAALFTSPPQNLLVADADGRIAQYLVGRTPVRAGGDGSVPMPGWDGAADWTGFVPFDDMPHAENPASGMLASANSRPAPPDHPVFLGRDWPGDWRLRRIGELLSARAQHDSASFVAMQNDAVSLFAREVLPALLAARPSGPSEARAQEMLLDWDGTMAADAAEPLIFHAWMQAFRRIALAYGRAGAAEEAVGPEFIRFLLHPDGRGRAWCGEDRCVTLLSRALDEAVAGLVQRYGYDSAQWRWDAAHVAVFEHPLLRFVPLLGDMVRLQAATPGDGETLARGGFRGLGADPFRHQHGAGFRAVFDLADPDGVLVMIATGQSGHPLSDHWGDMLQRWRDGDVVRLGRQPEHEKGRIRLTP
jgi:penicillin amidase